MRGGTIHRHRQAEAPAPLLQCALAALLAFSILTIWIPARWPLAVLQCGVFLLALGWAAYVAIYPERAGGSILLIPLAGIVSWTLLQLATGRTVYGHDTWDALLVWSVNLAVFFLALQIPSSLFLRAAAWFGCLLSIAAMLQAFTAPGKIFWLFPSPAVSTPPAGPFPSRNQYAAFIELLLPIAVAGAVEDRGRRLPYTFMAATMYASVIATASRAGAMLASAEVLLILGLALRRRLISARILAGVLLLVAIVTAAAGWGALTSRWSEPQGYTIRRELLRSSLEMIRDRPLMGFGLGTWSTVYPAYAHYDDGTFVNQAHNDWAQWTAEGGLPMLLAMIWIAGSALGPGLRRLWPLGLTAVFLHCLVDYPLQKPALEAVFFALLGAAVAEVRRGPAKRVS